MNTTDEADVELTPSTNRRNWWIAGGVVGAAAVLVIAAVARSKDGGSVPTEAGVDAAVRMMSRAQPTAHTVREHTRQPAYGPKLAQRKEILIGEHIRGVSQTA